MSALPEGSAASSILTARVVCGRINWLRVAGGRPQLGRDGSDVAGRGAWGVHESGAAVVLQFADGLVDVGERAVREALLGLAEVDAGIPATAQLLDRADVDHAVVQEVVQRRHVACNEPGVGADRVPRQWRGVRLLDVPSNVV